MVNTNGLIDGRPANETISRSRLHSGQVMPRFFGMDPVCQNHGRAGFRDWMHSMNRSPLSP